MQMNTIADIEDHIDACNTECNTNFYPMLLSKFS